MWSHWKIESRLQALEANTLPPLQRAALLHHLEHCPRCAAAWQQQQKLQRTFQAAVPLALSMPPGAADALFLRVLEQSQTAGLAATPAVLPVVPKWALGGTLAGATLTLALAGYYALHPARPVMPAHEKVEIAKHLTPISPTKTVSNAQNPKGVKEPTLRVQQFHAANNNRPQSNRRPVFRTAAIKPVVHAPDVRVPAIHTPAVAVTDDLTYVNVNPLTSLIRTTHLPDHDAQRLRDEIERTIKRGDDFVRVPFPQIAGRDLSAVRAAAVSYRQQREIVDTRLAYRVTLAVKGVSFATLCERLTQETGVTLRAGKSVADDKVTIFCTRRPLRDLMRQISRHFGFSWRRDAESGRYEYEIMQDVGAQLTEEELRNKDRDEALRALDKEMEAYRPYMNRSREQMMDGAVKAPIEEQRRMINLYQGATAPMQMYYGLSPQQIAGLYAGQEFHFQEKPGEGELGLPAAAILPLSGYFAEDAERLAKQHGEKPTFNNFEVRLRLDKSEAGQFTLKGMLYAREQYTNMYSGLGYDFTLATGVSPSASSPDNAAANNALAKDPAFQEIVKIEPVPSCVFSRGNYVCFLSDNVGKKITTADVMEAIHKATGQDIVADYFTHIYDPAELTPARDATLFAALNRLSDRMGMRWSRDEGCLNFRSIRFFHDRMKEIPDRLLERWADSRRKNKRTTLNDYVETAKLTDVQLNSDIIAAGVMANFGLQEWEIARSKQLRPHMRFLGQLSQASRQAAQEAGSLAFEQLPLGQRLQFANLAWDTPSTKREPDFDLLNGATLRVEFDPPDTPSNKNTLGNGNLIRFVYANKERWKSTYGPFNAITRLP